MAIHILLLGLQAMAAKRSKIITIWHVSVNGVSASSYFHVLNFIKLRYQYMYVYIFKCRKGVLIRQTIDLPTNTGGFIHCSLGIQHLTHKINCLCIYKGNTMVPILNKQLSREETIFSTALL